MAIQKTNLQEFDHICATESASEHTLSSNITVCCSKVYEASDPTLVKVIVSALYKMSQSSISMPSLFIKKERLYVKVNEKTFAYKPLPRSVSMFKLSPPSATVTVFYILHYYGRHGDGKVALVCSKSGNLGVLKVLNSQTNEKVELEAEKRMWSELWEVECHIVQLQDRRALLMPFCLHVRLDSSGGPRFCHLSSWNKLNPVPASEEEPEVEGSLSPADLGTYQQSPRQAAQIALGRMLAKGYQHDDFKWAHVALLPVFNVSVAQPSFVMLMPITSSRLPLRSSISLPFLLT